MQNEQSELSDTVATLPVEERQYVSQGYAAGYLGVTPEEVTRLINVGWLDGEADVKGDIVLFKMSDLRACRSRIRGEVPKGYDD